MSSGRLPQMAGQQQALEAYAFRCLVQHLREHTEVQVEFYVFLIGVFLCLDAFNAEYRLDESGRVLSQLPVQVVLCRSHGVKFGHEL